MKRSIENRHPVELSEIPPLHQESERFGAGTGRPGRRGTCGAAIRGTCGAADALRAWGCIVSHVSKARPGASRFYGQT